MRTLGFIVAAFLVSSELAIAQPQDTRRAPIDIAVRVNGPVFVVLASVAGAGAVAYRAWTRMEARHA